MYDYKVQLILLAAGWLAISYLVSVRDGKNYRIEFLQLFYVVRSDISEFSNASEIQALVTPPLNKHVKG